MAKTVGRRNWLGGLACLTVAACSTPPSGVYPELGFAHREPIRLAVAEIEVVEQYRPPGAPPNVDHRVPQPPISVMRRWADQRLAPAGTDGVARVIITDASIVQEAVQQSGGVVGLLSVEQSERYSARLAMAVEVASAAGSGRADAVAERSVTVLEDATLAEIEDAWFRMVDGAANDLDRELEGNIRLYLEPFVVP